MRARARVFAAAVGVWTLALCAVVAAQPNVSRPPPSPSPSAWVSVSVVGAPSSALVAAQAELQRLIRRQPGLRLGAPGAGAVPSYEIEIRVSGPSSTPRGVHYAFTLALTDLSTGNVLMNATGGATATGTMSSTEVVVAALRAQWVQVAQRIQL